MFEPHHLSILFGETRNEEIMEDAVEAVLGELHAMSGCSWRVAATEHLERRNFDTILHGLEHSLRIYAQDYGYSMPPHNRDQGLARSGRRGDGMVCNVFQFPSHPRVTEECSADRSVGVTLKVMHSLLSSMKSRNWGELRTTKSDGGGCSPDLH